MAQVSWYFSQWRDSGNWPRLHDTLRAQVRQQAGRHKPPTAGCVDSQSVKTTELGGARGSDKGKNVKGRKRHLLVETLGLLLAVVVTAASVSDPAGARRLFARLGGACKKRRRLWVDGGSWGQRVEWVSHHRRFVLRVTLRPEGAKGFVLLPRRWVVERTLAWLNQSRRLSKDYERLPQSSAAMMYLYDASDVASTHGSLNFSNSLSEFVGDRSWCPCERVGIDEAHLFARDEL